MILADTSVWVEHFRSSNAILAARLEKGEVLMHSFVLGELMLGGVRGNILADLRNLPSASVATAGEIEVMIESASLAGRGVGYVDVALLASARLENGARLWSFDRRLMLVAASLSVAFTEASS